MTVHGSSSTRGIAPIVGGVVLWAGGLGALFAAFGVLGSRPVNVVTYDVGVADAAPLWLSWWAPSVAALALLAVSCAAGSRGEGRGLGVRAPAARAGLPLALTLAVAALWLAGAAPTFLTLCLAISGFAWALDRLGRTAPALSPGPQAGGKPASRACQLVERGAAGLLIAAVLLTTLWHAGEQVHLWRHFMLGYADFGLFITELEHCLPWKEVGPARFADTRMGYHSIWMFYLLVPFYALLRTPAFLMLVGPLALNLAAVPFYQLARDRSGSRTVGLLAGLAWLALPSVSRLPYANTYGFQSIYPAVPWLAWAFCLGVGGRWRWSHLCLAAAVLCEETVCGVAFGWGAYLLLWGGRRKDGAWIMASSIVYLLICSLVVIPFFAESSRYTRWDLFGAVTPGGVGERLLRPRLGLYLLALVAPLLPGLLRGRRVLVAAAPTLLLVALLQEEDYLNIKYWHQSSVLPVLFLAAVLGVTAPSSGGRAHGVVPCGPGSAAALLVGVLLFHQVTGLSPLSRPYQYVARQEGLQRADPRMAAVAFVRAHFPPEATAVTATERMAAHFTDYREVHTARQVPRRAPAVQAQVLVLDPHDDWDPVVGAGRLANLVQQALAAGFGMVREEAGVLILERPGGGAE